MSPASRNVAGFVLLALMVLGSLLLPLLLGGCAAPIARARPLEAVVVARPEPPKEPRPCVSTLPTRSKLTAIAPPDRLAYLDEEGGEPRAALRLTVDTESLSGFFGYVESLEAIARKALGCIAR